MDPSLIPRGRGQTLRTPFNEFVRHRVTGVDILLLLWSRMDHPKNISNLLTYIYIFSEPYHGPDKHFRLKSTVIIKKRRMLWIIIILSVTINFSVSEVLGIQRSRL